MSAVGVRNFGSFQVPGSSLVFRRDTGRQAYKRVLEVASGCEYGTRLHHPPSSSSSPRLRYGATLVGPPDLLPHFPFGPLRLRPPSYEKLGYIPFYDTSSSFDKHIFRGKTKDHNLQQFPPAIRCWPSL